MTRSEAFRRWRLAALVAAIAGGIASIIGAVLDPHAFFPAWLAAFSYWLSLPLGALALLLIHNMTGGEWQAVARAPLAAAAALMPLFILAFLPILVGLMPLAGLGVTSLSDFIGMRSALAIAAVVYGAITLIVLARVRKQCAEPGVYETNIGTPAAPSAAATV